MCDKDIRPCPICGIPIERIETKSGFVLRPFAKYKDEKPELVDIHNKHRKYEYNNHKRLY